MGCLHAITHIHTHTSDFSLTAQDPNGYTQSAVSRTTIQDRKVSRASRSSSGGHSTPTQRSRSSSRYACVYVCVCVCLYISFKYHSLDSYSTTLLDTHCTALRTCLSSPHWWSSCTRLTRTSWSCSLQVRACMCVCTVGSVCPFMRRCGFYLFAHLCSSHSLLHTHTVLTYSPSKRLSATEALAHNFFTKDRS
jgi:hypothetical protein